MLVFETQVLKFGFYGKQTESVSEWRVDVERFASNLILLAPQHRTESSHVVQTVSHFDKNHAYVLRHCQQQFSEILRLSRSPVAENTA